MAKRSKEFQLGFDKSLLLITIFLIGLGLVQVFSSSFIFAIEKYDDGFFFFRKQVFYAFLSIFVLIVTALSPWKYIKTAGKTLWVFAFLGVFLTLYSGLGVESGGAKRWLSLPFGFRVEPAEALKICYPFWVGFFLHWSPKLKSSFKVGAQFLMLSLPLVFLLQQPDFGTFVICIVVIMSMYFVFGLSLKHIFVGSIVSISGFAALILTSPYRLSRVQAFLNPWADPSNKGFQVIQSMLSVHAGGLFGKGLGQGQAKLFFLPEAHTDFIFAIFAEEWGFIGVLGILLLYAFLIYNGLKITAQCKDLYAKSVSIGITMVIALNIFVNIGVVFGLLPPKGLTLPFMSYGGSSLLTMSFGVGVLLCISRHINTDPGFGRRKHSGRYYKINGVFS